jgi:hypothetical protein
MIMMTNFPLQKTWGKVGEDEAERAAENNATVR